MVTRKLNKEKWKDAKSEKAVASFFVFKWIGGDAFDCNIIVIIKYNCNFFKLFIKYNCKRTS